MKITNKHMACAWALLIMGLTSCSDDLSESTIVKAGDGIRFSAGSFDTRTIYDDENIFKINWEQNDLIKIYSNKNVNGGISSADYVVSPIKTTVKDSIFYNTGNLNAADQNKQLTWVDYTPHKFIAIYPHNAATEVNTETGAVKLPIHRNQVVQEVVKVQGSKYYEKKYGNYTYYAKPDMSSAYMIASKEVAPGQSAETGGKVDLKFEPIMTTLEIVVKGAEKTNDKDIRITGISVIRDIPSITGEHNTTFIWNAYNHVLGYEKTDVDTPPTKKTTETTFVSFKKDQEPVLKGTESMVMTVFMPPLEMNHKLPIKVRVHATGATAVETKLIPAETDANSKILGGSKRRITLPYFPTTVNGNNWITNLDDNIYVSQLSIPGTHDAGTGEGMWRDKDKPDSDNTKAEYGQTQEKKILEQLQMGIRAFDLRPSGTTKDGLWLYHGTMATMATWDATINTFHTYLQDHPGEFIIAMIRHEPDHLAEVTTNKFPFLTDMNNDINWANSMLESLKGIKNRTNKSTGKSLTVDFKRDLTIGDCRGKILFLCRSWDKPGIGGGLECPYTLSTDPEGTPANMRTPLVGGYIGWHHEESTVNEALQIWGPDRDHCTLYVQDCFSDAKVTGDFSTKKSALIEDMIKKSSENKDPNTWFINHTSGYTSLITNTNAYRENAKVQNLVFYNKMLNEAWINGPTGIIISDWVGEDWSKGVNVYGARMPQVIIDNNYKYHMLRKENTQN